MKRMINWGLLSTARINHALIPPLQASRRNQLLAVASRDSGRASAYAKENGIPRSYGSYEAMLADPDIDVIYNPLPNGLHAEWTIRAAQAGKHVLCEKPLATSLEEVDAMIEASRKAGVVVSEAFMYRHHPITLEAQRLVREKMLGEIQAVRGTFSFVLDRPDDVRWDPDLGGGALWDIGCYPVSYTRSLLGQEPEEVFAWQSTTDRGVDITLVGEMRFPGGTLAHFDCSFNSPAHTLMEVIGSQGRLIIHSPFHPGKDTRFQLITDDEEKKLKLPAPGRWLYAGEVEDMAGAVIDGKAPRLSLADSRANMATLLALYESARTGKPVHL